MAYVTPRDWTDGETVTAALLNQDIRDNIKQLALESDRMYHAWGVSAATSFVGDNAGAVTVYLDRDPGTPTTIILEATLVVNTAVVSGGIGVIITGRTGTAVACRWWSGAGTPTATGTIQVIAHYIP
jgi:hypothetical protein